MHVKVTLRRVHVTNVAVEKQKTQKKTGVISYINNNLHLNELKCFMFLCLFNVLAAWCCLHASIHPPTIYRMAQKERMFLKWVVVAACDFFLWGYLKSKESTFENLVQATI